MQHVRIMDIPFINESKINVLKSIHNAIQNKNKKILYFLGAEAKVNHALVKKVKMDYPDLIIGGSHHGFFELNDTSIVEDVKNSNADIIFVALGFPRQEKWIYQNYENFDKGVF